jgi:hypothetical protein
MSNLSLELPLKHPKLFSAIIFLKKEPPKLGAILFVLGQETLRVKA